MSLSITIFLDRLKSLLKLFLTPLNALKSNLKEFPLFFVESGEKMLKMDMSFTDFLSHFEELTYFTIKDVVGKTLLELLNQIAEKTLRFNVSKCCCACIVGCCLDKVEKKMRDDFHLFVEECRGLMEKCVEPANDLKNNFIDLVSEIKEVGGSGLLESVGDVKDIIEGIPSFFIESSTNTSALVADLFDISKIRNVSHFNTIFEQVIKIKRTIVDMLKKIIPPFSTLSKTLLQISEIIEKMLAEQVKNIFEKLVDSIEETNLFIQSAGNNIQRIMTPPSWLSCILHLDRDTLNDIHEIFSTFQKTVDLDLVVKEMKNTMFFLDETGETFSTLVESAAKSLAFGVKNCQSLIEKCLSFNEITVTIGTEIQKFIDTSTRAGIELGKDVEKALKELEEVGLRIVNRELERAVETTMFVKKRSLAVGRETMLGMGKGGRGLLVTGMKVTDESLEVFASGVEGVTKIGTQLATDFGKEGSKMAAGVRGKTFDAMVHSKEKAMKMKNQGVEMGVKLVSDVKKTVLLREKPHGISKKDYSQLE